MKRDMESVWSNDVSRGLYNIQFIILEKDEIQQILGSQ